MFLCWYDHRHLREPLCLHTASQRHNHGCRCSNVFLCVDKRSDLNCSHSVRIQWLKKTHLRVPMRNYFGNSGHLGITPPVGGQWVFHIKWDRHPLTPPSFCQGVTFSPFKMQQLFPIELLLLPLLLAFNKARGYQRVKEKLPWLCRSPDCTIRAVREPLYKGRARGRARWRLALPPW